MSTPKECELTKYAPHKYVSYIDNDGNIRNRPALCWGKLGEGGTVVIDARDLPRVASVYPPLEVYDESEKSLYRAWIAEMEKFILYPNYTIEELGDNWATVTRSDGVRFRVVGWLFKTILLELSAYPDGVDLSKFLMLLIARMAEKRPAFFDGDVDKKIAKAGEIVVEAIGPLYYECGLINITKTP
jgi:hypothetical protein